MEPIINAAKRLKKIGFGSLRIFYIQNSKYARLAEVGKLEARKSQGKYDTGQLFLHRVFGYRGIILFPWTAKLHEKDALSKRDSVSEETNASDRPEIKQTTHTFYQVLIDDRDCPYIRTQGEAVTFLGDLENSRSLYTIPGLDYVAHEDILPYTTADKQPLHHELFDKFFVYYPDKDPPFGPQDTLLAWQEKNHDWLKLSNVHKETTENIRVTAIPFYMGYRESQVHTIHWWRYCIRLENLGELTVQLKERHWRIFSISGTLETVRGRGVVGQQPILSKASPAFQYCSHVSLQTSNGHMWGKFKMEREDGYCFDCNIPSIVLASKVEDEKSQNDQT